MARVGNKQNIFDLAIQETGSVLSVVEMAELNDVSITDSFVLNSQLSVPAVKDELVFNYYTKKELKPATGENIDETPPEPLPYDDVDDIAAIYSMRRVRTDYTGPIIRIRRSSDGAEMDIQYNGDNVLDIVAIALFCLTGHGQVVKWYDQSGNGHDLSQAIVTNQPFIYYNGSLLTMGDKATLDLHNAVNQLACMTTVLNATITDAAPYTVFGRYRWSTSASGEHTYLFDNYSNDSSRSILFSNSGGGIFIHKTVSLTTGVTRPTAAATVYAVYNGPSSKFGLNGAMESTGDTGSLTIQKGITLGFPNLGMGGITDVFEMEGQVQELVWLNGDKSAERETIESIITDYYE